MASNMYFSARLACSFLLFLGLANVATAQCPPGMHLNGAHCAPGVAPNLMPQWGWVPSREDQIQSIMSGATQGEMTNPMQGRVNVMAALLEAQAESGKRIQAAINADPKLGELAKGWWEYFDSDKSTKLAYGCAAAFLELRGALLLSEAGDGYKEAIMTFIGTNIPRPTTQNKILVTLDQEDGRPQRVKALNFAVTGSRKLGAIALEVPSMKLLLDNMEDTQGFDILIDQTSVINIKWKNGHAARDQLRRCAKN